MAAKDLDDKPDTRSALKGLNELNDNEAILIVDDDNTLRTVIMDTLGTSDYTPYTVENVPTAKDFISQQNIDLIISDVVMPGGTGVDLLRWVKQQNLDIPFIIMTGHADIKAVTDALNLGANHFLQKPFRPSKLIETVSHILSTSKLKKQNEELRHELANYNARLRQEVIEARMENQQLFMATLTSLTNAIDARDAYTCAHSSSVAELSYNLAKALDLDYEQQEMVKTAAQLHDIGKIAVPENILLKPDKLTDVEFELIKKHPENGQQILKPLPDFEKILPVVRNHHERYDGSGYPDGLAGEEIPLLARIIAVCDTWNAMRTNRPYRNAMKVEKALSIIISQKGKQFDPSIADAFIEMLNEIPELIDQVETTI